jgi:hypothetical protein
VACRAAGHSPKTRTPPDSQGRGLGNPHLVGIRRVVTRAPLRKLTGAPEVPQGTLGPGIDAEGEVSPSRGHPSGKTECAELDGDMKGPRSSWMDGRGTRPPECCQREVGRGPREPSCVRFGRRVRGLHLGNTTARQKFPESSRLTLTTASMLGRTAARDRVRLLSQIR